MARASHFTRSIGLWLDASPFSLRGLGGVGSAAVALIGRGGSERPALILSTRLGLCVPTMLVHSCVKILSFTVVGYRCNSSRSCKRSNSKNPSSGIAAARSSLLTTITASDQAQFLGTIGQHGTRASLTMPKIGESLHLPTTRQGGSHCTKFWCEPTLFVIGMTQ